MGHFVLWTHVSRPRMFKTPINSYVLVTHVNRLVASSQNPCRNESSMKVISSVKQVIFSICFRT